MRLESHGDEASLRSAVSRAYYYVYHLALARAEQNQYRPPKESGSHIDMWRVYSESPVPECIRLGVIGERMFRKRVDADYRATVPRLVEVTQDVLQDAKTFADLLSRLDLRHPKQSSQRR